MPTKDDRKLVDDFKRGDEQAFNELVRSYQQPVYQTARRLLGSHEEAEDLSQEVFVKAYRKLKDFRGDSSFFTWIYRITVNLSLNALRKQKIRRAFSLENAGLSIASRTPGPDQRIERDETLRAINEALELPRRRHVVDGRRYEETPCVPRRVDDAHEVVVYEAAPAGPGAGVARPARGDAGLREVEDLDFSPRVARALDGCAEKGR